MALLTASRFLDFLISLRDSDFKSERVNLFLKNKRFEEDTFLPFIHFRDDTYGRNLVYKNRFFELSVLTWLPEHRTPIHDHAGQRCWMFIDSGELTVKNFAFPRTDEFQLKPLGPVEVLEAGERVYVDDSLSLHSITNASSRPAVSVHLYAGPIESCRVYNEATRRLEKKELSYLTEGVWSPQGELIESRLCEPLIF